MSSTVRSYGYIARLLKRLAKDEVEEVSETLWENNSVLSPNYDGTLLYSDMSSQKGLSEREDIYGLFIGPDTSAGNVEDFVKLAEDAGLPIDPSSVVPYNCIWYNGSDSYMSMLTDAEFKRSSGK